MNAIYILFENYIHGVMKAIKHANAARYIILLEYGIICSYIDHITNSHLKFYEISITEKYGNDLICFGARIFGHMENITW